jgi:hypothetical protein
MSAAPLLEKNKFWLHAWVECFIQREWRKVMKRGAFAVAASA